MSDAGAALPAVALLHFFGSSRREWQDVMPRLAIDGAVHALDLPGFGDAAALGTVDVAGMAAHVQRWCEGQGVDDCILVGHSMGGKVAAAIATLKPAWLRGLVLLTASPPGPEPTSAEAREKLLAFDFSADAAARYVDDNCAAPLPAVLREQAIADARRASPAGWRAWIEQGSQEDWSARVGVSSIPTLVIAGADDASLGEDVQRRCTLPHFADTHFIVLDGAHLLPLENAAGVAGAIAGFRAGLRDMHEEETESHEQG